LQKASHAHKQGVHAPGCGKPIAGVAARPRTASVPSARRLACAARCARRAAGGGGAAAAAVAARSAGVPRAAALSRAASACGFIVCAMALTTRVRTGEAAKGEPSPSSKPV
jgi:hypothetical protein